jgi:hypothetical protein
MPAWDLAQILLTVATLNHFVEITILGDFNMRSIDWQSGSSPCPVERNFLQFCDSWDLKQLVSESTRGGNVLDIILTTCPEQFSVPSIQPPLVNSDHNTVIVFVQMEHVLRVARPRLVRCFPKADYQSMAQYLTTCQWSEIFHSCRTVNDYWCALHAVLSGLIEMYVPLVNVTDNCQCRPKLPKALRKLISLKRKARRRWKSVPNSERKLAFNLATRRCKLAMRTHMSCQENNLLSAGPRKFYSYVSKQLRSNDNECHLQTVNGLSSNANDIAATFNEEFSKNFAESPAPNYCSKPVNIAGKSPSLSNINIDVTCIRLALAQLSETAAGPDIIPAVFYKRLAYSLGIPLSIVFNQSLYQEALPDARRLAKVIALYKGKGDRSVASSYRPISLTAVACKVLERLVADQVRSFLLNNTLICRQQHGFMTSRSTATNLLCCDAAIAQYLNRKSSCDVVLLDFARAFDKVSHAILSRKLLEIGIQGKLHAWLINFLANRSQYVNHRSASSAIVPVSSGVIQGSVLGPLLFTVFINDLPRVVTSSSLWLFADDVKIVSEASTDVQCDALQRDLEAVWEWSEEMRLPLCLQKCQCLHIGLSNRRRVYNVNGESVSVSDKCVDLGIIRNSSFSYDDHIRSVISKASRAAGMIYRVFSLRSTAFLTNLFRTYVIPILEYVSPMWSPAKQGLNDDIERVLRRYTKRLPALRNLSYEQRLERQHVVVAVI